ncbi:endo-1,4-beta-xylanase [Rheinheimera sp. SA_1]|uniref:endo-1,4-beta-xylanase n=1 Tax=Rheinheimera sp. SA_1 TaxID=1827365 RepID=UPI0009EEAE48|nr:endo-1,4-beta-xylanase [Rheinheimera sp. SA_1]
MNLKLASMLFGIALLLSQAVQATAAPSLQQAYQPFFHIGTAVSLAQLQPSNQNQRDLIAQHFNSLTAENLMKWEEIQPTEGNFVFEAADQLVAFAEQHRMWLVGHTILWHEQTPDWVFQGPDGKPASQALLLARLKKHIQTVVGRYQGRVHGWDVVNEALNEDGSLRDTPWRKILGDDYIATTFALVHKVDPKAKLYYNDYNLYKLEKRAGVLRIIQQLQQKNVPIHAIGEQAHYGLDSPKLQEVEDSINAFAATGLDVMLTELEISVLPFPPGMTPGADISQHQELQQQLNPYRDGLPKTVEQAWQQRYLDLFSLLLRQQQKLDRVTFWGLDDGQSWRNNFPMRGRTDYPLLFDRKLQAKPLLSALIKLAETQASAKPKVNQLGFAPHAQKLLVVPGRQAVPFQVNNQSSGKTVLQGQSSAAKFWPESGEWVSIADFSTLTTQGRYQVEVAGLTPITVEIAAEPYAQLHDAAVKAYYFNRASMALEPRFAGPWARAAGHPDTQIQVHASAASDHRPAGFELSAAKGWYDAGDYNKYVVNSGITSFTLLQAWQDFADFYRDRSWNIPESTNDLPDILDETLWNLQWLSAMQDPNDGGVYHKLTELNFSGTLMPDQVTAQRYVVQKTTAAALNFAAVMAKASRTFTEFETQLPGLSQQYRQQALLAWQWAKQHPDSIYQQPKDVSTGAYGDKQLADEWAWAGAELYLLTNDRSYLQPLLALETPIKAASWANVGALGYFALASATQLEPALRKKVQQAIQQAATQIMAEHQASAYQVAMSKNDFVWGSNAVAMNKAILLYQAWKIAPQPELQQAMQGLLDYVLGRNPLQLSYVTGFGQHSPLNIHHRPSAADAVQAPIPGWLVGGAQPGKQDKCTYYGTLPAAGTQPATTYLDDWCSYATNEVAINWNAPLVYVTAALSQQML